MRRGRRLGLAGLAIAALALALTWRSSPGAVRPAGTSPPPGASPAPRAVEAVRDGGAAATRRNIFRFADERDVAPQPFDEALRETPEAAVPVTPPSPAGPRLVGLVRRDSGLLAALSLGGEVELAAEGEIAAGVLVLAVGEDFVRVRGADGGEVTLRLP